MVAERRGLGTLNVLEPPQILGGQLPECDAPPAALLGIALEQGLISVVLTHQREHSLSSLRLSERSLRRTATLQAPASIPIRLGPRAAKRAHNGPSVA